ncbi:ABC transporter ATP-binding protein [Bradyrhizobium sp. Pear77]|uniref:ABC transporter ATP-binding protein n=1 Tax=Bradyrhizobium altum TaxID=1571202 RepID=UPI0028A11F88|nr:ABC transporter ATP-binding protein [Bradyrhizobium altum]MCC8953101.1 ABC transporter ATP-binding protein [Bradyrhizobium altum]
MALLELSGLTKRFGAFIALDDISLLIERGEVHCLLGENGAGKSTLCNLVFGVHRPDGGTMTLGGEPFDPRGPAEALQRGVVMVHQHFSLVPTMSVAENLMLGRASAVLKPQDIMVRMEQLAAEYGLEIDPEARIDELSVGERQRVEIIKCLLGDPQLLVLDEPTAVLQPDEIDALLAICRQVALRGKSVILVTHKLGEISRVADRTTVLRQGRIIETVAMDGADIRSLVRSMVGRDVQSAGSVLAAAVDVEGKTPAKPSDAAGPVSPGEAVLQISDLVYRDPHGVPRLDGLSLTVGTGEIVGIAGVEGNGQTELGLILAGLASPSAGAIVVGGTPVAGCTPQEITDAGVGIVPEDRHAVACIRELSVAENLFLGAIGKFSRFGLLDKSARRKAAEAMMRDFDVRASSPDVSMASLSGGNQQKAVLARELSLDPLVFLLAAQPTRGLDVGAIEAVYNRIRAARDDGLGVLLISSELEELMAVSDRIAVIYRGKLVGELAAGSFSREAIGAMMSGHAHV